MLSGKVGSVPMWWIDQNKSEIWNLGIAGKEIRNGS